MNDLKRCDSCEAYAAGLHRVNNGSGTTYLFCGQCWPSFEQVDAINATEHLALKKVQKPNQIIIRRY